ncbi:MAG TPA: sigma-70 family RNA polymerase sigma factor [Planctomycetota bacterium]|nr:sigma-70 family RNA polymerase sigma factor [Planctomycetota bacterium]
MSGVASVPPFHPERRLAPLDAESSARFGELYRRTKKTLLGLTRKNLGGRADPDTVDDVVAEVARRMLARVARGETGFLADESAFVLYAAKVVRNLVLDLHEHRHRRCRDVRRELSLEDAFAQGDEPKTPSTHSPSRACARKEQGEILVDALASLPPRERDLVQQRVVEKASFQQLGRVWQMSADGVRKLFVRVFARLARRVRGQVESKVPAPKRPSRPRR